MKKQKLKKTEYECAACHGIFEKGWSDEEAAEEFHDYFPDLPIDDETALICDPCYEAMLEDMRQKPEKYAHLPPYPRLKGSS